MQDSHFLVLLGELDERLFAESPAAAEGRRRARGAGDQREPHGKNFRSKKGGGQRVLVRACLYRVWALCP